MLVVLCTGRSQPPSMISAKTNKPSSKVLALFKFLFLTCIWRCFLLFFFFSFWGHESIWSWWVSFLLSGLSQIVMEAQKSVGWYHDESDSGARADRVGKKAVARRLMMLHHRVVLWGSSNYILPIIFFCNLRSVSVFVLDLCGCYGGCLTFAIVKS